MANPVTLIASTSNASASSGVVNLNAGAIVSRWAVMATGQGNLNAGLSLSFSASVDGTNFAPVQPASQRGNWYVFDSPAAYVSCGMAGNATTTTVFAVYSATTF